jgi:hypothetical protein
MATMTTTLAATMTMSAADAMTTMMTASVAGHQASVDQGPLVGASAT